MLKAQRARSLSGAVVNERGRHAFVDLAPDHPELDAGLRVLGELRQHRTLDELRALYIEGYESSGYRLTVLVADDLVQAVSGHRILTNTAAGRHFYIDDLVTRSDARSHGHGAALLAYLVTRARAADCSQLMLDSGTHRIDAHRFYFREGLVATDFHFRRDLGAS